MDLASILQMAGGVEGPWNRNYNIGAKEAREEGANRASIEQLLAQAANSRFQVEAGRAKLPGELQMQGLDQRLRGLQGDQAAHNLSLDQQFGARTRQSTLEGQEADNAKKRADNQAEAGKRYIDDVAGLVAAKGSATPEELMGLAKKNGLDANHPLVQMFMNTDPRQLAASLPKVQGSSTAARDKQAEIAAQGRNQIAVANIQAGASRYAADQRQPQPRPQSTDQLLAQWKERAQELKRQLAVARSPQVASQLSEELAQLDAAIKEEEKRRQDERTASKRAELEALRQMLQGQGGGGPATPNDIPRDRVTDFSTLNK